MALDPLTPEQRRAEFAAPPPEVPPDYGTGNPADDRLLTVRIATWTFESRRDPHAVRAVKVVASGWVEHTWQTLDTTGNTATQYLTDEDVATWPIEHYVGYWPTLGKLVTRPESVEPPRVIEGDMTVEAFRASDPDAVDPRHCPECLLDPAHPDADDPITWCDCQPRYGEKQCAAVPCKQRAHHPDQCPHKP